MDLKEFFQHHPKAALGFSGGVDSSYLLYAAKSCGADIGAYFIKSPFQPEFELEDARAVARQLNTELRIIECDILENGKVAENPPDRCYHCKRTIFSKLAETVLADGYELLIDGTNASDPEGERPGMRALRELEVLSPLRLCGITKDQVRRLSKEAGLFTWNKPAYACLATRVPSGQPITAQLLQRVEAAESALKDLGFSDFRIRVFHDAARLQLKSEQLADAVKQRREIRKKIMPYFEPVLLDLEDR